MDKAIANSKSVKDLTIAFIGCKLKLNVYKKRPEYLMRILEIVARFQIYNKNFEKSIGMGLIDN
jgi:hypothetical protein